MNTYGVRKEDPKIKQNGRDRKPAARYLQALQAEYTLHNAGD